MIEKVTVPGEIELDRFAGSSAPAQVVVFDSETFDSDADQRDPHRHDYHELLLVREGWMEHLIDDQRVELAGGQVLLIGRGQVHRMLRSTAVSGAAVRFGEELILGRAQDASPGWMLVSGENEVLEPPTCELSHALGQARLLHDELRRPPDAGTDRIISAALTVLLTLVQRWHTGSALEGAAGAMSPDTELLRSFVRLLEAEYHRHHDASWYASQLAVSPSHLAAVLTRLTGRSTKRMITDRVMTEVARLLRFTDLTVQQIALRLGYDDPLYLSRAFKAHTGESPSAWRQQRAGS